MKRTIDDIEQDYKSGSLDWDSGKVFQAVTDIHGLIAVIRGMKTAADEIEKLTRDKHD